MSGCSSCGCVAVWLCVPAVSIALSVALSVASLVPPLWLAAGTLLSPCVCAVGCSEGCGSANGGSRGLLVGVVGVVVLCVGVAALVWSVVLWCVGVVCEGGSGGATGARYSLITSYTHTHTRWHTHMQPGKKPSTLHVAVHGVLDWGPCSLIEQHRPTKHGPHNCLTHVPMCACSCVLVCMARTAMYAPALS